MPNLPLYDPLRGSSGSVVIAVDSSDISVHKCGGCISDYVGERGATLRYNSRLTLELRGVIAMEAATDDKCDSEALLSLIDHASMHRTTIEACMDESIRFDKVL
jgi:hypothetical protein